VNTRIAALTLLLFVPFAGPSQENSELRPDPKGWREIVYRGGAIVEERLTAVDGNLIEEIKYGPSGPIERRSYVREGGRLARVDISGASGAPTGSMEYRYDVRGRLLRVEYKGAFGTGGAGMVATAAAPSGAWTSTTSAVYVRSLDQRGRPLVIETLREGKVLVRETRSYGDGAFPIRAQLDDIASDSSTVTEYDGIGRPMLRVSSSRKTEISRVAYAYDDAGRLVEESTRIPGSRETRRLSYGPDGALSREEFSVGAAVNRIVSHESGLRIEELYQDGELFVRTTYSGGRKIKDEFFEGGALRRFKEYN
jgi:YD repeat-containing protein